MTGFNFFSHGSQDLFPKMIETAKGKSASVASKATIIGNVGAIDEFFLWVRGTLLTDTGRHNRWIRFAILRSSTRVSCHVLSSAAQADAQNPALSVLHCLLDSTLDPPEQLPRTRRGSLLHPVR